MNLLRASVLLLLTAGCGPSAPAATSPTDATPARPHALASLIGRWRGGLTYKDYTSGKGTTIPAAATGSGEAPAWKLAVSFPDEPGHEQTFEITQTAGGYTLGDARSTGMTNAGPATTQIVFEERGKDGNDERPCVFRHVVVVGRDLLTIQKLVRFDGEADFFERNIFRFDRDGVAV